MSDLQPEVRAAVEAAQDKQASNITVLKLSGVSAFADYFVLCSGQSGPQLRAISEAIEERLDREGMRRKHREGKTGSEWVLLDYGSIVIHIFGEGARRYYDLERLWRHAERLDVPAPGQPAAHPADADRPESNP
ncbi:MAG: ribosome silencing factor [Acidobacteriota bacterium]|nr:ribosome silencing factor [Acidobacteriota bacterium]MDE3170642.1 ribosome silencing factor [Acidobacteriota bacterium]